MYAYLLEDSIKLYRPLSPKDEKWRGSKCEAKVYNLHTLPAKGQTLILTSSVKDSMVLNELGFAAICFGSEGINLSAEFVAELKQRFEYIFIFMDTDVAGLKANLRLSRQFECPYLTIPEKYHCKDIADISRKYGLKKTKKIFQKRICKQFCNQIPF